MSTDYIPRPIAARLAWLANFAASLAKNKAALSLTDPQVASMTTLQAAVETTRQDLATAEAAFRAKQAAADAALEAAVTEARLRARQIQADPNVEDELRAELALPLRDTTPTPPAPLTSRPVITIDFSQRLQHTLGYRDSATPTSRARPDNATGCEFRRHIGTAPPSGIDQFQYLETDRATPFVSHFNDEDAGKIASYIARWVNANGDKGPWSETVSATIVG